MRVVVSPSKGPSMVTLSSSLLLSSSSSSTTSQSSSIELLVPEITATSTTTSGLTSLLSTSKNNSSHNSSHNNHNRNSVPRHNSLNNNNKNTNNNINNNHNHNSNSFWNSLNSSPLRSNTNITKVRSCTNTAAAAASSSTSSSAVSSAATTSSASAASYYSSGSTTTATATSTTAAATTSTTINALPFLERRRREHMHTTTIMYQYICIFYQRRCRKSRWLWLGMLLLVPSIFLWHHSQHSTSYHGGTYSYLRASTITMAQIPHFSHHPPTEQELQMVNGHLHDRTADEILTWAVEHEFAKENVVQLTSFGPSGMVILDSLHRLGLLNKVAVVTVDTLHLFPETYQFWQRVQEHYASSLSLQVFAPDGYTDRAAFDEDYGAQLWKTDPDKYGYLSKVEPMERALEESHAAIWITGRRSTQGGERTQLQVVEYDNINGQRLKLNPLAYWSYQDVWNYIRTHNVPYHPLHDKGYKSIGDIMTTIAVAPNAPERSGRFVGLNKTECGMHSHLEKIQKMKQEAAAANVEFEMPTLPCDVCIDVQENNFQQLVLDADADVLLEFYSPLCGACQEFAPAMHEIAQLLHQHVGPDVLTVMRYDITSQDITPDMSNVGFSVEATPTLFLVQRNPLRITRYDGAHHAVMPIMQWLSERSGDFRMSDVGLAA